MMQALELALLFLAVWPGLGVVVLLIALPLIRRYGRQQRDQPQQKLTRWISIGVERVK